MPQDVKDSMIEQRTESRSTSRFAGRRVHFIGIGGTGMSGLARMLADDGAVVTGSEPTPNEQTMQLNRRGVRVSRDQLGELLSPRVDLVVRSAAVRDDNPEYLAARKLGIRTLKYAQLLGEVMEERVGIAVAGTHGKSTTSAMISHAMVQCGAEPSFVIGGTVPQLGGGSRSGTGRLFVAEACEYDRSFHNLWPRIAVITNIEEDHLDCYKDIGEIVESFRVFASRVKPDGLIITSGADVNAARALEGVSAAVQTCGFGLNFNWSIRDLGVENGRHSGEVCLDGTPITTLRPGVPGVHNLMNGVMALAACKAVGMDPIAVAAAISTFRGVDRRMTEVGQFQGAIVVDDYGHHPTEIRATLRALRERYEPRRLFCVFQPHQHSRTRFLLEDFAGSFADATETIVPDIYFVRDSEKEKQLVSATDLVARITGKGQRARHIPVFPEIVKVLREEACEGDLIVTMGAGNVWEIGRMLVESR